MYELPVNRRPANRNGGIPTISTSMARLNVYALFQAKKGARFVRWRFFPWSWAPDIWLIRRQWKARTKQVRDHNSNAINRPEVPMEEERGAIWGTPFLGFPPRFARAPRSQRAAGARGWNNGPVTAKTGSLWFHVGRRKADSRCRFFQDCWQDNLHLLRGLPGG